MPLITLLHADTYNTPYAPGYPTGFESVRFPVRVKAEPYRFPENPSLTLDTLMVVSNDELERIGYTGPMLPGGLSFGTHNASWRPAGPFEFWNALKTSRDVGALPA